MSLGGPQQGDKIRSDPQCGQIGYITPAVWGVPNKGTKSEVAHMWADWLYHSRRLGGPQQGDKIRSGPHVGGLSTSPLPSGGSPTREQNQNGPHVGRLATSYNFEQNSRKKMSFGKHMVILMLAVEINAVQGASQYHVSYFNLVSLCLHTKFNDISKLKNQLTENRLEHGAL